MKPTTQLTCVRFQIFQKLVKRHGFRQKPDETPENFSGEYGHYQLGRKLGAGAYGTVYLATEQQSGTHHGWTSGIRDPKKSLAFFLVWIVLACRMARGTDQVFIHLLLRAVAQTNFGKRDLRYIKFHWWGPKKKW